MRLSELKVGQKATVIDVDKTAEISRRFEDLGIISGTKIECVLISPMKNPKAYLIRGTIIAFRNEDASYILVKNI